VSDWYTLLGSSLVSRLSPLLQFSSSSCGGRAWEQASWVLVVEPAKNSIRRHIQLAHNVGFSLLAKFSMCIKYFVKRPMQVHMRTCGSLILILSQIEDMDGGAFQIHTRSFVDR